MQALNKLLIVLIVAIDNTNFTQRTDCDDGKYLRGGLGTGPNPQGPQPTTPDDSDDFINRTQYLPLINDGEAGVADFPTVKGLAAQTAIAERQIVPTNAVATNARTRLKICCTR